MAVTDDFNDSDDFDPSDIDGESISGGESDEVIVIED